ncbi:hypothetical protein K1T71_012718 [Dendrolimus kikuchii]|uniref:Uncharacterized protein n=1 Tax=Dendrolimus kikuchii TaxID=765133 RepID=A0ACC1CKC6_9NEOP|nr:hypothetical protein K1T71_012718 [Dendrolimus kikuchii]
MRLKLKNILFNRLKNVHNISTKSALSTTVSTNTNRYKLSEDQMDFYSNNGYLIINKLFDTPALDSFRKRFEDFCLGKVKNGSIVKDKALISNSNTPEEYIHKIQDVVNDEVFMSYSECPRMLDIVSQFIGGDITVLNLMMINKPPGTTIHPTHQDIFYFPFRPVESIIAAWTAVDRVVRENGGLYIVPGSHKAKKIYEHEIYKDSKQFFHVVVNQETVAPDHKKVYLELDPGDTVFFNPYLLHGSHHNISKNNRKCMSAHYVNSNSRLISLEGTIHEGLSTQYENELRKDKLPDISFTDFLKRRMKLITGRKYIA